MEFLQKEIEDYVVNWSEDENALLKDVSRETYLKVQMPQMCSGHYQGVVLKMISNMIQPKRVLEIGTFTGYATLCLAEGLTEKGILYTLDINEELEPIFSKYFDASGLSKKIKFIPGNAIKTIPEIDEIFDLVFIDADKHNYCNYFDLVIEKTRIGGFIIADNVLWSGKVAQEKKDKDTQAIHDYNIKIKNESRVENVILPIRDGLNIARRIK